MKAPRGKGVDYSQFNTLCSETPHRHKFEAPAPKRPKSVQTAHIVTRNYNRSVTLTPNRQHVKPRDRDFEVLKQETLQRFLEKPLKKVRPSTALQTQDSSAASQNHLAVGGAESAKAAHKH